MHVVVGSIKDNVSLMLDIFVTLLSIALELTFVIWGVQNIIAVTTKTAKKDRQYVTEILQTDALKMMDGIMGSDFNV